MTRRPVLARWRLRIAAAAHVVLRSRTAIVLAFAVSAASGGLASESPPAQSASSANAAAPASPAAAAPISPATAAPVSPATAGPAYPAAVSPSPAPPASHRLFEATSHRSFEDVDYWKSVFDDPGRDAWQKPREVIAALGIGPGMTVADLGAGTGYFTHHLAKAVAPGGTVYAIDTEPNLVTYLRARAEQEGAANVTPVLASADDPRLPAAAVDVVLVVDTFHHIDQRLGYFQRLKRVLRPGGRVAIIDWRIDQLPVGPPPDHKIAREQVIEEMEAAGYRLAQEPAKLLPYHYVLVFEPS